MRKRCMSNVCVFFFILPGFGMMTSYSSTIEFSSLGFLLEYKWAPTSEFVSSSIPSWQVLTAHAQPFREARDLAFCLKVPLNSLIAWASSGGSGETARMRRLAWTFAARIGDKYQIRLTRSKYIYTYMLQICEFSLKVLKVSFGIIQWIQNIRINSDLFSDYAEW